MYCSYFKGEKNLFFRNTAINRAELGEGGKTRMEL